MLSLQKEIYILYVFSCYSRLLSHILKGLTSSFNTLCVINKSNVFFYASKLIISECPIPWECEKNVKKMALNNINHIHILELRIINLFLDSTQAKP